MSEKEAEKDQFVDVLKQHHLEFLKIFFKEEDIVEIVSRVINHPLEWDDNYQLVSVRELGKDGQRWEEETRCLKLLKDTRFTLGDVGDFINVWVNRDQIPPSIISQLDSGAFFEIVFSGDGYFHMSEDGDQWLTLVMRWNIKRRKFLEEELMRPVCTLVGDDTRFLVRKKKI